MDKEYHKEIQERMKGKAITNDGRIVKLRPLGTTRADHHRGDKWAKEDYLTQEEILKLLYKD